MLVRRQESQPGSLNMQLVVSVTNEWMASDNPACLEPVPGPRSLMSPPSLIYHLYLRAVTKHQLCQPVYFATKTRYSFQTAFATRKKVTVCVGVLVSFIEHLLVGRFQTDQSRPVTSISLQDRTSN